MPLSPVATDNFNAYANGTKLAASANWDAAVGTGAYICRTSTVVEVDPAFGTIGADYWAGAGAFTDPQYSQVVCSTGGTGDSYGGPAVQVKAADDDWYHLVGNGVDAGGPYLEEANAASITTLTAFAIDGWDAADVIRIEYDAAGVLHAVLNGVELGTDTPSFALTGGLPGLGVGFEDGTNPKYDNWEGGNITAGGSTESISGTSAGTSADSAAVAVAASLGGASAGTSADTAAIVAAAALAGTSAGTSTDTAAADIHVEGTATSAGTSLDTGSITVAAALSGTSPGTSSDSGALAEASDVEQFGGTSAGTSTDTGAVSARATLAGTSAGTSTDSAGGTVTARISATSAGASLDTGAVGALAALAGTAAGTSADTGTLRDGSIPLVPSQTHTAAARTFTSTARARPRVWTAPGRD